MSVSNDEKKFRIRDVFVSLKLIPQILNLIKDTDKNLYRKSIVLSIISGIIPILTLYSSQYMINNILEKNLNAILSSLILYLFVSLINSIISNLYEYYDKKFQTMVGYKLQYKVMQKSSTLSLSDFEDAEIYDKLQRIQNQIVLRPYQVFRFSMNIIMAIITLLSSILIIIFWRPMALIILIISPIFFVLNFFKIAEKEFNIEKDRTPDRRKSWYMSYLLTRDTSFKEIKVYNLKNYILNIYKIINEKIINQDIFMLNKRIKYNLIFEIVELICSGIILYMVVVSAYIGEILLGNVVSYIKALNLIQSNSRQISNQAYMIYQNNLYISELFEFLNIKKSEDIGEKSLESISQINIRNLSFKYNNLKNEILKDINIDMIKGERLAIVGSNGSGKSTLIKLLLKLYEVENEKIFINNVCINEYKINSLRENFTVLFQDFLKYELTLKENIGFGNISDINNNERMIEMLDKLQIEFIDNLDQQLGLWFAEGRQLSGGEWQKIAIARSFFRSASVYILDEPSSALDPISEKNIIDEFMKITKDKIGIFITHRISTAKLANKIIVMDNGEIIGSGTHEELLINNQVYKNMYQSEIMKGELKDV